MNIGQAQALNLAHGRQRLLATITLYRQGKDGRIHLGDLTVGGEAPPCTWQDIGDDNQSQVDAKGGDVVVVTFIVP
jgi:hypothetical protein